MSLAWTLVILYLGIVSSDMALYGIGAVAARSPAVRRTIFSRRIERLGGWLKAHAPGLIVLARPVPGLMFPVYVGCGLYRVPFLTFAKITFATAAVYLPMVFLLISGLGAAVLSRVGYWGWIAGLGLVALGAGTWVQSQGGEGALKLLYAGPRTPSRRRGSVAALREGVLRGMPVPAGLKRAVARSERIPMVLFYVPLVAQWIGLGLRYRSQSLPTLANPNVELGGLWGESKSAYFDMLGAEQRRWIPDYAMLERSTATGTDCADLDRALAAMDGAGLGFPVVAKPDIGWRGFGVQLIADRARLAEYIAGFPAGRRLMLQRPLLQDGEAGVLYARMPGAAAGRILSLTFRYFPHVTGDGSRTLRELILARERTAWKAATHLGLDAMHRGAEPGELDRIPAAGEMVRLAFIGSNRVGGLYRDGRDFITPAMERRFDEISQSMPDFYYGRFDIRFDSIQRLQAGEGFGIIEINGAGGESINIWDPDMPLGRVYGELFAQQSLLFEIGARNRDRGFRPAGAGPMLRTAWRQNRLIVNYPPSG